MKARNRHCLKSLKIVPNFPTPLVKNKMESVLSYNGATVLFLTKSGGGAGAILRKLGGCIANALLYSYLVPRETLLYIFFFLAYNDSGNKSTKVRK